MNDVTAEPAGSVRVPGEPGVDDHPQLLTGPGRPPLVLVRRDTELTVYHLGRLRAGDRTPAAVFPAPWPRDVGGVLAVSPDLAFAVFPGLHTVQAVEPSGRLRWEVRHSCWGSFCLAHHVSYAEYAEDPEHRYPDSGSSWISADGTTVWAHVSGPLPGDDLSEEHDRWHGHETWLVLAAADGRVLARARTGTAAAGSHHVPHPDPAAMGLGVGEGQDGSPLLWGRLHEGVLDVHHLSDGKQVLIGASPDGHTFVSIGHADPDELTVHRYPDGTVLGTLFAGLPPHGDPADTAQDHLCWDLMHHGFVDDRVMVASTSRSHGDEPVRHWLVDVTTLGSEGISYPHHVRDHPLGIGGGRWVTLDGFDLHVWRRAPSR
ncbi:hypothetical protein [Catellatospora vulcania]|uniref:hypothetical protein n=1 Tax=Catellatospora vulcania TaxID=1460450 RepID=UPI0012D3E9A1|nr:hypothetical protein [Catellatospora vulcania]